MRHINFRMGHKNFNDIENFPHGFVESGLFTDEEEEILIYWGETMCALEIGDILPINQQEEHFVQVLDNPKLATSALEKAWLKYRSYAKYYIPSQNHDE